MCAGPLIFFRCRNNFYPTLTAADLPSPSLSPYAALLFLDILPLSGYSDEVSYANSTILYSTVQS